MNTGRFLLWYWRYGSLDLVGHESLRDAVAASEAMQDSGGAATDHFEELGVGVVPDETVERARDELFASYKADAATREPPRKLVTLVEVQSLKDPDSWATIAWLYEGDDVDASLREARRRFGSDRVRQRPGGTP